MTQNQFFEEATRRRISLNDEKAMKALYEKIGGVVLPAYAGVILFKTFQKR